VNPWIDPRNGWIADEETCIKPAGSNTPVSKGSYLFCGVALAGG
jgi:hypothetical protein